MKAKKNFTLTQLTGHLTGRCIITCCH